MNTTNLTRLRLLLLIFGLFGNMAAIAQFTINCTPTTPASDDFSSNGSINIGLTSSNTITAATLTINNNLGQSVVTQTINIFPINLNFNSFAAGSYTATLSATGQTTVSCNFTIGSANCGLDASINTSSNCTTESLIEAFATNGNPPYSYLWNNQAITPVITVGSGTWTVTVTDDAGCTTTKSTTIGVGNTLAVNCSSPVSASDIRSSNGEIAISFSGGQAPYMLRILDAFDSELFKLDFTNPTPLQLTGFSAGQYTVQVNDMTGCFKECEVMVEVINCNLQLDLPTVDLACFGVAKDLTAPITGGLPPYRYTWSNGAETATISVDGSFTPTVTITDQTGCSIMRTATVNNPSRLNLVCANFQNVSITGEADGNAVFNISGGTAPYQFEILKNNQTDQTGSVPNLVNTFTVGTLSAGTFQLLLTDANDCTANCTFTLTEPTCDLQVNIPTNNLACFGDSDGVLTPQAMGGVPPYQYLWENGQQQQTLQGLPIGTYQVSVTDSRNCRVVTSGQIAQPTQLAAQVTALQPASTAFPTGKIDFTISGGTPPYQSELFNQSALVGSKNGAMVTYSNLTTGTFSLTAKDGNGCTAQASAIVQTCDLSVELNKTDISCNDFNDGIISVNVQNNLGNLTYQWNNPAFDGQASLTNLSAGNYVVTVTDLANNCILVESTTVNNPSALSLNCSNIQNATIVDAPNGSASFSVSGGNLPYHYQLFQNGVVAEAGTIQNLDNLFTISTLVAGGYQMKVTDVNDCSTDCSFFIGNPNCVLSVTIPSFTLDCTGEEDGILTPEITGGLPPYQYFWENNSNETTLTNLSVGDYGLTVTDAQNCQFAAIGSIIQPSVISIRSEQIMQGSLWGNTGALRFFISGGTPPYASKLFLTEESEPPTLINSGNEAVVSFSDLPSRTFLFTVTDANGCTSEITSSIQPCNLRVDATSQAASCQNATNGSISLIADGNEGALEYEWSNSAWNGLTSVQNLSAGDYSVTITDQSTTCSVIKHITVAQINAVLELSCQSSTLYGITYINFTIGSGTPPFIVSTDDSSLSRTFYFKGNYNWTVTSDVATALTVIDANGCESTCPLKEDFSIGECIDFDAIAFYNQVLSSPNRATVEAIPLRGSEPYQYQWSDGQTTRFATFPYDTEASVTITDGNGCRDEDEVIIPVTPNFQPINTDEAKLSVVGQPKQNQVRLAWFPTPRQQATTSHYLILKSIDNQPFSLFSKQENQQINRQIFLDEQPVDGTNLYRLVRVAQSGEVFPSVPLEVDFRFAQNEAVVFPNPTTTTAQLHLPLERPEKIELAIYDAIGQLHHRETVFFQPKTLIPLDLERFESGIYFIKIKSQEKDEVLRIVVERLR
ncbi:MAG: T9SS type A sorting domain-containing protein [Saprospiraceae bacterium]